MRTLHVFKNSTSLARFGWNAIQAGELEAGCEALQLAVETSPENAELWLALGVGLARQKRWRAARETIEQACALAPDSAPAWCALADVCLEQNDYARALDALERVVKRDPEAKTGAGTRARLLAVRCKKRLAVIRR